MGGAEAGGAGAGGAPTLLLRVHSTPDWRTHVQAIGLQRTHKGPGLAAAAGQIQDPREIGLSSLGTPTYQVLLCSTQGLESVRGADTDSRDRVMLPLSTILTSP